MPPIPYATEPAPRRNQPRAEVARIGKMIHPRRQDRMLAAYPYDITPDNVKSALQSATMGYPRDQVALFDRMVEADAMFAGIYATRKNAAMGMDWQIVPDPKRTTEETQAQAEEIAEWCYRQLVESENFDSFLHHSLDAIGYGIAVSEIVWTVRDGRHVIAEICPVPMASLIGDNLRPWIVRVLTNETDSIGVLVDDHPFKFVKRTFGEINGNPFRGGIARRCALLHLAKTYGFRWWMSAMEMFGVPYRKATYTQAATAEEKNEMLAQLEAFGHAGYGLFSEAMNFEFVDQFKGAESWPHAKVIDKIHEWYEITTLGQTLTTQVGETGGAFAAAKVHNEVRSDILYRDLADEAATIRRHLLKPLVELNFGPGAPIPVWQRVEDDTKDMVSYAQVLDTAVNRLGIKVPVGFAHKELGVPIPDGVNPADVLEGAPSSPSPSPFDSFALRAAAAPTPVFSKKKSSPSEVMAPLIRRAVQYSIAQVRLVIAELRGAVTTIRDSQDVATLISNRLPQLDSEQFADAMAEYLLACRLTGVLSVQRVTRRRAANPPVTNGTFDQVFKSAVEALRGRLVLDPDQFLTLEREARSRAGRVAGEFNLRLVQDIYDAAVETLESGGTLRDFRLLLDDVPKRDGWGGSDPWHANIVMHQNAMMAYSSGAYQEAVEIGATAWTYEGYEDSCPICSPFIGKKFDIRDTEYVPPLHFNCDCWQSFHYEPQSDVTSSKKFRNPAYDESQESPAAFKYDPASFAKSGPFSLKSVPDELKPAFRRHAKQEGWEVVE